MKKVTKKEKKEVLINSLGSSILATIIIYLIVGPFNADIVKILPIIAEKDWAIKLSLIMFPIMFIVYMLINIGMVIEKSRK